MKRRFPPIGSQGKKSFRFGPSDRLFQPKAIPILLSLAFFLSTSGVLPAGATAIFDDQFLEGVSYLPFLGTDGAAVTVDSTVAWEGAASLKFHVPDPAEYPFLGGVLASDQDQDLTGFNALTFYARASGNITLDIAGYGNDNTGTSRYEAGRSGIPLSGEWQYVVLPIPAPSRLAGERGLFTIAESCEPSYPAGYDIWIDELRWTQLSNIETYRPSLNPVSQHCFVGTTVSITGTRTIFRVDGGFVPLDHSANYFDYVSSDPSVAHIQTGAVMVVGEGTAMVTATVENQADPGGEPIDVLGSITVAGYEAPTEAATSPTLPDSSVISMFSEAYPDIPVDTWRTDWSTASHQEYMVDGRPTKMYTGLGYAGIVFESSPVDASAMTHYHVDAYAPTGNDFKLKFVSFPPALGGAGIESIELTFNAGSTPAFTPGGWVSLFIPLADFTPADPEWDWGHLGQMIISGSTTLILLDNLLFLDASTLSPVVERFSPHAELFDAYPNPFNPRTSIAYVAEAGTPVRLSIYDVAGRLIRVLVDEPTSNGGRREVVWDGRDGGGRVAGAGIYFYRLETGSYVETKRMTFVK